MDDQTRQWYQMRRCLDDLETALRLGNTEALIKGVFIWSQRKDHILDGEETWNDQQFSPTEWRQSVPGTD